MAWRYFIPWLALLAAVPKCPAQGWTTITFDGPPFQPPRTGALIHQYTEASMQFSNTNVDNPLSFIIRLGGGIGGFPEDGSAYLQSGGNTLMFATTNGALFSVTSVDLAEYSIVFQYPITITFVGYRPDETTVTNSFTTDGKIGVSGTPDFQTFHFGYDFNTLTRVVATSPHDPFSLDNLVVSIDEPTGGPVIGQVVEWGGYYRWATNVAGLSNVLAIAAGSTNLALMSDGTVTAWKPTDYKVYPFIAEMGGLSNVVSVAGGGGAYLNDMGPYGVALKGDGTVDGWGYFIPQPGLSNVAAVAAGGGHYLALTREGTVVGWGINANGQATGTPSGTAYDQTSGVVTLGGQVLTNVVAIAAGVSNSVALRTNGTVVAWGDNSRGQTNVPTGLSNVVALASGRQADQVLAIKANGTVTAWGGNWSYQTNLPVGLSNVVAAAAGSMESLVLVGSSPLIPRARLTKHAWDTNGFRVSFPTQSGRVYCLEYKNAADDATWTPLPLVAGNGGILTLTDPTAPTSARF